MNRDYGARVVVGVDDLILKSLGGEGVLGLHTLHKHQGLLLYTYDSFVARLIPKVLDAKTFVKIGLLGHCA